MMATMVRECGDAMGIQRMSDYESKALIAIHEWKDPSISWFDRIGELVNWPLSKAGDLVLDTPGVGAVIRKSVSGLVSMANDLSQWSVRQEAIFEEYRDAGFDVSCHADLMKLDLENVDHTIGWLAAKYKTLAASEGAVTGLAGLPGIPADVVALVSLNLRAIGEYATYCGFDVNTQQERLFALHVLGEASSPTDASKTVAVAQLVKIAHEVAKKRVWKELERHAFVQIVQQIAKAIGVRLTKAKLAAVIPGLGAAVSAGFNAYFTDKVCDAAFYLYRERFLAEKYADASIIEETTPPADTPDPRYPEANEELPRSSDDLPDDE